MKFEQKQYDMLKRCSAKKDMTEWNEWRERHPDEDISLEGAELRGVWLDGANLMHASKANPDGTYVQFGPVDLKGANFEWASVKGAVFAGGEMSGATFWSADAKGADFSRAHLENAELGVAHFEECDFCDAILKNADFSPSFLNGAKFTNTDIRGCTMRACVVDGATRFWECRVSRYSNDARFTDIMGTALGSLIIDPGTKQLLEYNIRRMNWEEWYKAHGVLRWPVRWFWWVSDYGSSTGRIVGTFFTLALVFAAVYYASGFIDYYFLGTKDYPGVVSNLFVLEGKQEVVSCWLVPFRAAYFSIVTMTTLGFADMNASAYSFLRGLFGHMLLAVQVILGYVLLGALVTRFAVLFTAGGPAGEFADEKDDKEAKRWG
jgi:hypothetical protein